MASSSSSSRATEAFKQGDYVGAAAAYSEALAEAENSEARAKALTNRAQCHLRLKKYALGREDAASARSLAPENPKAWYRLGICEACMGLLADAETSLLEASQLLPRDQDIAGALTAIRRRREESNGKFAWPEIWKQYLGQPPQESNHAFAVTSCRIDSSVDKCLDVEPFVGPVRIGFSELRGRGLFVTEDVPAGELLLCAQALATGSNDTLPSKVVHMVQHNSKIRDCVLSLSRGTADSEQSMPPMSLKELVAPRCMQMDDAPDEDAVQLEEIEQVLFYNQHSLPLVNPNNAPIEVNNDPTRSGLWLLPAFTNHSCRPNVQRTVVHDCLFLRAGRDLKAGDELLDCYVSALQPVCNRRSSLESYGISACLCERCILEESLLDPLEVQRVVELAAEAKKGGADEKEIAEKAEFAATQAEVLVGRSLERGLVDGSVPQLRGLPVPAKPLTAERMAMIREGIEKCVDMVEEESFSLQELLHKVLLASLVNILRSFATSIRGLKRYVDAAAIWERIQDTLDSVISSSELAAIVSSEALSAKLQAFHLDHRKAGKSLFQKALLQTHRAYGGGAAAWQVINEQTFAASVLEGAPPHWDSVRKKSNLREDTYNPEEFRPLVPEPRAQTQVGFEDLLKKRAKASRSRFSFSKAEEAPREEIPLTQSVVQSTNNSTTELSKSAVLTASKEMSTGDTVDYQADSRRAGIPLAACSEKCESASENCASYEVIEDQEQGTVSVHLILPGLSSASEADLQVSDLELRVKSLRQEYPHALNVPLPTPVNPASTEAKWRKRSQRLTVILKVNRSRSALATPDYAFTEKHPTDKLARGPFLGPLRPRIA